VRFGGAERVRTAASQFCRTNQENCDRPIPVAKKDDSTEAYAEKKGNRLL
jgi:hypothetical protein